MAKSAHVHKESLTCTCSIQADEPREDCPQHGFPWPPRCGSCGQFMSWAERDIEYTFPLTDVL